MADNSNVVVSITGDASQVAPAVEQAKSSLGGIKETITELNANMMALTEQMKKGFGEGATAAKGMSSALGETKNATEAETGALAAMIHKIHESAESVRTFQMRAKEFAEVYVAMFAVETVAEWAKKMGEAAEHVKHLGQEFGMTAGQVQSLQGVAIAMGVSIDTLTRGMGILDSKLVMSKGSSSAVANAFKQMGLSADDGKTNMEKLVIVSDKFAKMEDGPKKVALSMELFGKSGRDLIPVLNMGSAALQKIIDKSKDYNVVNEEANKKGVALAESINESKLAMAGISNVLTDAFAPVLKDITDGMNELIKSFIDSYNQGGIVKDIFLGISNTVEILGGVFNVLGTIWSAVWSLVTTTLGSLGKLFMAIFGSDTPAAVKKTDTSLITFKDYVVVVQQGIIIFGETVSSVIQSIIGVFTTLANVVENVPNWGKMEAAWDAGMDHIARDAEAASKRIQVAMDLAAKAIDAASKGIDITKKDGIEEPKMPKTFDPTLGASKKEKKPKKEKKAKDDLVQKLEQELTAQKTAWDMEQDALGTAVAFKLETEKKYWSDALKLANLSAKDKAAIEGKYLSVSKQIKAQQIAEQLEVYKSDAKEAQKNESEKLRIAKLTTAYMIQMHGANSKEAKKAMDDEHDQFVKTEEQKQRILFETHALEGKLRRMNVEEAVKNASDDVALGIKTQGQLIAIERNAIKERYEIDRQGLEDRLALMANDPSVNPEEAQKLRNQITELDRKYQSELTQNMRQAEMERDRIRKTAIDSFSSSWSSAISKLATLQQGFAATFKEMYSGLVQTVAGALQEMLKKEIALHLSKMILHHTEGKAKVLSLAAQAGAGGTASMAAAPWPLDMSAPAFGASMSAATMAYLPSAEGGWWDVQPGLANLHANEMVLPAWAAAPLRDMIGGGKSGAPANFNAPGAANDGGAMNITIHAVDSQSVRRLFMDHKSHLAEAVRKYARDGGR